MQASDYVCHDISFIMDLLILSVKLYPNDPEKGNLLTRAALNVIELLQRNLRSMYHKNAANGVTTIDGLELQHNEIIPKKGLMCQ